MVAGRTCVDTIRARRERDIRRVLARDERPPKFEVRRGRAEHWDVGFGANASGSFDAVRS
jgi:hypothetical protein